MVVMVARGETARYGPLPVREEVQEEAVQMRAMQHCPQETEERLDCMAQVVQEVVALDAEVVMRLSEGKQVKEVTASSSLRILQ